MMSALLECDFHPFRLDDRETLTPFFMSMGSSLCEYSFAVQFCWQSYNRSDWAIIDDMLVVRFVDGGEQRFLCPAGHGDRRRLVEKLMNHQAALGFTPRIDFVPMSAACPNADEGLFIQRDRDNDDYVFLATDLADLPGRKFSQKRNHISALSKISEWEVRQVEPNGRLGQMLTFIREWSAGRDMPEGSAIASDHDAMVTALQHAPALRMDVFELIIDKRFSGLSIGSMTSNDTYTIHFEKALPEIRGAYQAICSGVAGLVRDRCMFINREQDMGVEGLRKTKHSWNPVRMEECCSVIRV